MGSSHDHVSSLTRSLPQHSKLPYRSIEQEQRVCVRTLLPFTC